MLEFLFKNGSYMTRHKSFDFHLTAWKQFKCPLSFIELYE